MNESHRPFWTDERTERVIGNLLRLGVILAAAVVIAGGIFYLIRYGRMPMNGATFQGEPASLSGFAGIVRRALALSPRGIIQLGLLVLMATPVARVVFALVAFLLEGDRLYVLITGVVLGVLVISLLGGRL